MSHVPLISASLCSLLIVFDAVVETKSVWSYGVRSRHRLAEEIGRAGGLIYSFDVCVSVFMCVCVCRIIIDIPQAHTLSHGLKLIRCTKPWNPSSLLFSPALHPSLFSHPALCLSPSRLFPFALSRYSLLSTPLFCFFVLLSCICLSP